MHPTAPRPLDRRSLALAALSTVVEWYDFTLYLYLATVLSRVFFSGADAVLTALLGFAMAYLMRPVGAMVFGHFGDRHGRRATLLASMAMMTIAMLLTALLPTAAHVGPLAGVLLLALRCVMGFAVGGEYTGVVAYLLEGAPPHRRGFVTSLAAATSEVGGLLAAGVSALTVSLLPAPALDSWGWRVPFLFGAVLAGAILFARAAMAESPEFEARRKAGTLAHNRWATRWRTTAQACCAASRSRRWARSRTTSASPMCRCTSPPRAASPKRRRCNWRRSRRWR
jgi:MHS family proline/betaine transporter-like MFS transporter